VVTSSVLLRHFQAAIRKGVEQLQPSLGEFCVIFGQQATARIRRAGYLLTESGKNKNQRI
jgi:hypothetical protein